MERGAAGRGRSVKKVQGAAMEHEPARVTEPQVAAGELRTLR